MRANNIDCLRLKKLVTGYLTTFHPHSHFWTILKRKEEEEEEEEEQEERKRRRRGREGQEKGSI